MIDKNWIRWIRVGLRKYFESKRENYHFHLEGMPREKLGELTEYAEFRVDGPHVRPYNGSTRLDVDISVILTVKQNMKDLDAIYRISGIFHAAFTDGIEIYRLGGGPDDDETLLGCLTMTDQVKYNYFGVVEKDIKLEQASLLARYHLEV